MTRTRIILGSVLLLLLVGSEASFLSAQQSGGSFVPTFNYLISGLWNFAPTGATTAYDVPFKANGSEVTGIVSKVTDLSNAQVLALNSTGVTVVAAPGVGKSIDVVSVTLIFKYTAAYTSPQNVRLYYGARTAGNAASATITGSGFFDATANVAIRVAGTPDNTNPSITNQAVVIQQPTFSAMGGGNASNTVRVVVNYRIVATNLTT